MTSLYGILLIALLVIVGGVIAYVGDIVGRRLGRKRLSLFGMRPRHTAITVSVVSGMLITMLTLGAAITVSKDVKDGFLRVAEMRLTQSKLSSKIKQLNRRAEELERARKQADQQLRKRKVELDRTKRLLAESQQSLSDQQQKLAQEKKKLAATSQELREAEGQLKQATRIVSEQWRAREALEADVARAIREAAVGRALPILFGAGQPLDSALIQGGQSLQATRKQLDALVSDLDEKVSALGARPLSGSDACIIIQHPIVDVDKKSISYFTGSQVIAAVAGQIREAKGSVIVRAYSVFNTVEGEPVYVDFQLFNNYLVFRRGERLAETIIDGRLSEPDLMNALVGLLRGEVAAKARQANVMPRLAPLGTEDFASIRRAVGEMSHEDLFAHIAELRRINGPARVAAVAAEDTRTSGPLQVSLSITPVIPTSD